LSDSEAQKNRPPMLNSDSRPVKPAATAATAALGSATAAPPPSRRLPKISCTIGLAMLSTPMPAETFSISASQISQNCGVLCASRRCAWPCVIIPPVRVLGM
jgi:hypothetical protein